LTGPQPQAAPPAEQTTASEAGVTLPASDIEPLQPALTAETGDDKEPRPSTLATQEIRLALAFTGGVSLAVWMGGVARELDLLVQASTNRRILGEDAIDPKTPDTYPVRRYYRRLLDLIDAQVAIDVLAGTSAGGINAALLGLVNARRLDLSRLRDIWLRAGDFARLLRDANEDSPPSLLKGDGQMLAELAKGIGEIIGVQEPLEENEEPHPRKGLRKTDVFITTTLLSPETSSFTDDYGTQIDDSDHHGMFHLTEQHLNRPDIGPALALAARSSASFPGAFEPSFIPFGKTADDAPPTHPDMSPYSNTTASRWAADGGLLVNRPIAPVLQTIFDKEADRQVRRVLLYVVPSSGSPDRGADRQTPPLSLAGGLIRDLQAILNQSIAADLAAIREHNDRIAAAVDTRLRLATLGNRLPDQQPLVDNAAWQVYRERQSDWLIAPLIAEVTRQVGAMGIQRPNAWTAGPGINQTAELRAAARDVVLQLWGSQLPRGAAGAAGLGRPAFDSAKATLLRLLRLGYTLATTAQQRNDLAKYGMHVHRALGETRTELQGFVSKRLTADQHDTKLEKVVETLATDYGQAQGSTTALADAWSKLSDTFAKATPLLEELAGSAPEPPEDASLRQRRASAAQELQCYLRFLRRRDAVTQLLDLHIAVRSVLPVLLEVEQRVELIQLSANTRSTLAPDHRLAKDKLTGLQLHHFAAFYKSSWRANDWMWGRLDGCGWLVHMLLDPRRILTVMENLGVEQGKRAGAFAGRLAAALDKEKESLPPDLLDDLKYLDSDKLPIPESLPTLALWVAETLQQHIVAEELPVLGALVRGGPRLTPPTDGKETLPLEPRESLSHDAVRWLAEVDRGPLDSSQHSRLAHLLNDCPIPSETFADEAQRRTPLFLRTATHATAVATSAGTAMKKPPASLRPTFATARTVTRAAHAVTDTAHGRRRPMTITGAVLVVAGALAMLTDIAVLGLSGLVLFAVGATLLAFGVSNKQIWKAIQILAALLVVFIAAIPWLPWFRTHVFSWLSDTAIPWIPDHKWVWPILFLLVLLPPITTLGDWLRARPKSARKPQ
jgi:patatin-related protein